MKDLKSRGVGVLRSLEKYTETDMVYVTKNILWINANTIIVTVFSFILSILLARFVSKDIYGIYQFILSIGLILGSFTLTGMNAAVTQAAARGFDGVFISSVKTQLKFGLIPFSIGMAISLYYLINGNLILSVGILATAILLPMTNSLNTWGAYLGGKKEFGRSFFYNQIINVIYYGGIIASVYFFPSALMLVLVTLVTNFASNLFIYLHILKNYNINKEGEKEALDYGKKLSLSSILPMISIHIDNLLIFHLLGAQNLAIYAFASNIPERFMGFLRPLSIIALPKLSEKNSEDIGTSVANKLNKFFIIAFLWGLIYIAIAPFLYKIFFPQYIDSLKYSFGYIIFSAVSTIGTLPVTALFASRSNKIFKFNIVNPIFNISSTLIGGYTFGIWGVIIGRIVGSTFSLLLSLYFTKQKPENI